MFVRNSYGIRAHLRANTLEVHMKKSKKSPVRQQTHARRRREASDRNHIRLLHIRSAVTTAILALERQGVLGDVAILLRMSVLNPLREIEG